MANAKQYGEGDKLALYGLFKQAKWGDCPAGLVSAQRDNPVGSVKVRAWVTNRGKPTSQAMQEFIAVLGRVRIKRCAFFYPTVIVAGIFLLLRLVKLLLRACSRGPS